MNSYQISPLNLSYASVVLGLLCLVFFNETTMEMEPHNFFVLSLPSHPVYFYFEITF